LVIRLNCWAAINPARSVTNNNSHFLTARPPSFFLLTCRKKVQKTSCSIYLFIYKQWKMDQNKKPNVSSNSIRTPRSSIT
jgi:hypothetical protein